MKKINNKGFTLIEVLSVIVIIAILGLIAVPSVISSINKSKDSTYAISIKNIKTASQELFEELEFNQSTIYHYNQNGNSTGTPVTIIKNDSDQTAALTITKIEVTLQTLINNGFLAGTNNTDTNSSNKNKKVLINPKTDVDIGFCEIVITKKKESSGNVTYTITNNSQGDKSCPTDEDYK